MKFVFLLALVSVLVLSVTGLDLRGKWKEDQNQRQGLNDFLYEMGKTIYSSFVISDTLNHTGPLFKCGTWKHLIWPAKPNILWF